MRVHPTELKSSNGKWQFGGVMMLFAFFMGYCVFDLTNENQVSKEQNTVKVVVVQSPIEPKVPITKAQITYLRLPISSVPTDVVKDYNKVIGKYSQIPLTIGTPIALSLLENASEDNNKTEEKTNEIDPIEKRLEAVYPNTVAVTLPFLTVPPDRGSRVAISIQGDAGRSVLVAEEAWVERVEGNFAQIRVPSHMALYLEEAKSLGVFSSLMIPLEGKSPFLGQAVVDIYELRNKLIGRLNTPLQKPREKPKEEKSEEGFSSYAWIRGDEEVFAIDRKGRLHTINKQGQVEPLQPYKRQHPAIGFRKKKK